MYLLLLYEIKNKIHYINYAIILKTREKYFSEKK